LYIFDNTPCTTHTTYEYHPYHAKKTGGTESISTAGSLHIRTFLLHTSSFQPVVQGGIVYHKKPFNLVSSYVVDRCNISVSCCCC
jgi:hypothetical protein